MTTSTVLYGNFKIFSHQLTKIIIFSKKLENLMISTILFINLLKLMERFNFY